MNTNELKNLMKQDINNFDDASDWLDHIINERSDIDEDDVFEALGRETLARYSEEYDTASSHYDEDQAEEVWDELRLTTRDELWEEVA